MVTGKELVERIRETQRKPTPSKPIDFSKLTSKVKPTISQITNLVGTGKTKINQAITPITSKIRPTLSNVKSQVGTALNTKQGIKLRVTASQLNNLLIDKSRSPGAHWKGFLGKGPGKGFLKKTPVLGTLISAVLASSDYNDEKTRLVSLGYKPQNASKIAFLHTASEYGGYGAGAWGGGAVGGLLGFPTTGPGGVVTTAVGAGLGGAGGGWAGRDLLAPLLIKASGLKRSKAELQNQLTLRKKRVANIARTNQLKDEAGDQ